MRNCIPTGNWYSSSKATRVRTQKNVPPKPLVANNTDIHIQNVQDLPLQNKEDCSRGPLLRSNSKCWANHDCTAVGHTARRAGGRHGFLANRLVALRYPLPVNSSVLKSNSACQTQPDFLLPLPVARAEPGKQIDRLKTTIVSNPVLSRLNIRIG